MEVDRSRPRQALLACRSCCAIAPNNLAYLLATQTSELDEALKDAQQARELAPANADVEGTLGCVLYRKGMFGSAPGLSGGRQPTRRRG